jgi:hypothetical protein
MEVVANNLVLDDSYSSLICGRLRLQAAEKTDLIFRIEKIVGIFGP